MKSLFRASIYHKRMRPRINEFSYTGLYIKFSLEDMVSLKSIFFSVNRFNLFSFYEKDHGPRDGTPLDVWGRGILEQAGIAQFKGRFELQTFPRMFGYVFNPVSFWYCYEQNKLVAVICEVNNTFGESHCYVVKINEEQDIYILPKEFHVSPFYAIKGYYQFNFSKKDSVSIHYCFEDKIQLITVIKGEEVGWNDRLLLSHFFQYPFFTIYVVFLIHLQAFKLFIKKNKFYSKPNRPKKDLTYEHNL